MTAIGSRWKHEQRERGSSPAWWPILLIVGESTEDRRAIERMLLRRDDLEIVTADTGHAALQLLLKGDVALVIIGAQVPDMDGLELASLIHRTDTTCHVPVIVITEGPQDQAIAFRAYKAGAVDYLLRPVDGDALRTKVDMFVALARHRQQLREADRMRETFIAVLGHDLRGPLSAIVAGAQLLEHCGYDEQVAAPIERILRNAGRMERMIEQLLDAAAFRAARGMALSPTRCDLHALTTQLINDMQGARRRVRLQLMGAPEGMWDVDRVLQVLTNLIGNALKHSPQGSPVVIAIDGQRQDSVLLHVHSCGPAVPHELRDHLFEPFRRVQLSRRRGEGLGLGLYITKQLVDAHGGAISFDSSETSGTCFSVTLPRQTRPLNQKSGTHRVSTVPIETVEVATRGTILLVESDWGSRLALDELLQGRGYQVLPAQRPSEALQIAASHDGPIDVRIPRIVTSSIAAS